MTKTKLKEPEAGSLFEAQTAPEPKPPAVKPGKQKAAGTAVAVASPKPPASLLEVIGRAAADPNVDVAKMRELLALKREIDAEEEAARFAAALLDAQREMLPIKKDRQNDHTKSWYATLEKVSKAVDRIAQKHGFSQAWGTADSPIPGHYRVVCDLSHGKCTRRYFLDLPSDTAGAKGTGNKSAVQGVGSTMSYGRRYLKVMMFDLVIEGEDKDGNRQKPAVSLISQEQVEQLIEQCEAVSCPKEKLCDHLRIDGLAKLPAARFDEAVRALTEYDANRRARLAKEASGESSQTRG